MTAGVTTDFITELKSQVDARDVIGEYVELKGTGDTRSGICPFHEDRKASLVVGRDGYRCMACGEKGDAIAFLQEFLSLNFKEAVTELARHTNMSVPAGWGEPRIPDMVQVKPKPRPKSEPQPVPIPACPSGEWDKPSIIRISPIEKTESGKGYGPYGLDFRKVKIGNNLVNVDRHFWYDYSSEEESAGVVRLEYTQDGKRQKIFRQLQKVEDQWRYNGKGVWEGYREREIIAAVKKRFSEYPSGSYPADLIPTIPSVEGEKCAEAIHRLGLACLTHRGSASMKEKEESLSRLKKLHPQLVVVHLEDNDEAGARKGRELIKAGAKVGLPVLSIPTARLVDGQLCEKGDVVDVLENMDQQKFINRLEKEIHKAVAERQAQDHARESLTKSQAPKSSRRGIEWNHNLIAKEIAEKYRGQMAWDVKIQEWRRYSSELEGIWAIEPKEFIRQIIRIELEPIAEINRNPKTGKLPNITDNVVSGVKNLLKDDLAVRHWNEDNLKLIPFENGVFNLETRELIEHAPSHYLTWCLPYSYNPEAKCDKIRRWMLEMSHGNQTQVDLFRAYLYAIVTARTDWHSYLEMIGPGGTGKSTFINLAIALVGARNTHTTQLRKLEDSRFETACLKDKRLINITDAENFIGNVTTLKALTGGDFLPYERKKKNSLNGFFPTGKLIVAANEPIRSTDYTSGLERRRLTVEMTKQIKATQQRNLITFKQGKLDGEFVPEIPGLLNWVLDLGEAEAEKIIKGQLQSQTAAKAKNLIATNPLADWADLNIIYDPEAETYVGDKSSIPFDYLYASYNNYCERNNSKPVASNRYTGLFEDLLKNQLKLRVSHRRGRKGSHFLGVKLRFKITAFDDDNDPGEGRIIDTAPDIPLLISGKFNEDPPPENLPPDTPPSPPPKGPQPNTTPPPGDTTGEPVINNRAPVINPGPQHGDGLGDGSVTGRVTAGTPGSDGCDGCDGFLSNSVEKELEIPKVVDSLNVNVESEEKITPNASHPSQPITSKGFGHHQPVTSLITHPSQSDEPPAIDVVQSQQTIEASSEPEREQEQMEIALGYIAKDVERLGWTAEQERQFLLSHYQVDDRTKLHFSQMTNLIVVLEGMQPEGLESETKSKELEEQEQVAQLEAQSEELGRPEKDREQRNKILDGELERIGWTRGMETEELQKKYGVEGGRAALAQADLEDWQSTIKKIPTAPKVRFIVGGREGTVIRKYQEKHWDWEEKEYVLEDMYELLSKGNLDTVGYAQGYQVEIVDEHPF